MAIAIMHNRFAGIQSPAAVTLSSETGGSVSGGGTVYVGAVITVKATPDSAYNFVGWYSGSTAVSSDEEYTFKVTGNVALTAKFSKTQKAPGKVTVSPAAAVVTAGAPTLTGSYTFVEGGGTQGRTVTLSAAVGSSGEPDGPYTYQWYENDRKLSGETGQEYTTGKMNIAGTYRYYCMVSNGVGAAVKSSEAVVTVQTPDWKIKVTGSTTLKFTRLPQNIVDVFLVGGGGSGVRTPTVLGDGKHGGGGGSGGFTATAKNIAVAAGTAYPIVIGAGGTATDDGFTGAPGGDTTAFGKTAKGGGCGSAMLAAGGYGGSGGGGHGDGTDRKQGGAGGSDGGNGKSGSYTYAATYGFGQGKTTREFGEKNGTLYAGGGGGGSGSSSTNSFGDGGKGGAGGGGNGAGWNAATDGKPNTGGGGGGCCKFSNGAPGMGGSGVVIIRNHRG